MLEIFIGIVLWCAAALLLIPLIQLISEIDYLQREWKFSAEREAFSPEAERRGYYLYMGWLIAKLTAHVVVTASLIVVGYGLCIGAF